MKEDAAFVKIVAIVNVDNIQRFLERKNINLKEKCSYFPCHDLDYDKYDCRSCYCPFYDICSKKVFNNENVIFGGYLLKNTVLACEKCTFIHNTEIVDYIYSELEKNTDIKTIYSSLEKIYLEKYKEDI